MNSYYLASEINIFKKHSLQQANFNKQTSSSTSNMATPTNPFKSLSKTAAKEQEKLDKKMIGMSPEEKLAFIDQIEMAKALKKMEAAKKRRLKNVREGKVSRPKAKKFSTAAGSDYDRIKTFNGIVRYEGGFTPAPP